MNTVLAERGYQKGQPIVFYCSVGYRSSKMAHLLSQGPSQAATTDNESSSSSSSSRTGTQSCAQEQGPQQHHRPAVEVDPKDCFNLEGSIFKWANEDRPIQTSSGSAASLVHPYNTVFGFALDAHRRAPIGNDNN